MRQLRRHLPLSRGIGLMDALIALAILAFGLLALSRFQSRMVAQTTESQSRQVATQLAGELMSTVLVDATNAACYTLPQTGACSNSLAVTRTAAWQACVAAALPGPVTATSTLTNAGERLQVNISWLGKDTGDSRSLEIITDVR